MNRSMTFFLLLLSLSVQIASGQDYLEEDYLDNGGETIYREEGSTFTEMNPPISDEVAHPEIERQEEDLLYPDSENSDWSLENEELPAEEWE